MSHEIYMDEPNTPSDPLEFKLTDAQQKYLLARFPKDYVLDKYSKTKKKPVHPVPTPKLLPPVPEPLTVRKLSSHKPEVPAPMPVTLEPPQPIKKAPSYKAPETTSSTVISLSIPPAVKQDPWGKKEESNLAAFDLPNPNIRKPPPSKPKPNTVISISKLPTTKQAAPQPHRIQISLPPQINSNPNPNPSYQPEPHIIHITKMPTKQETKPPPVVVEQPPKNIITIAPPPVIEEAHSPPPPEIKPIVIEKKQLLLPPPPVIVVQKPVERMHIEPPAPQITMSTSSKIYKPTGEVMTKCLNMLQSLKKHICAGPFLYPVDVVGLGLKDYKRVIKEPMDISTVERKLKSNQYPTPLEMANDVRKIWFNAMTYNAEGSEIYNMTAKMQHYFEGIFNNSTSELTMPAPAPVVELYDVDKKIRRLCKQVSNLHHKGGKFIQINVGANRFEAIKKVPMTQSDKRALFQNIHSLPVAYLKGVMDIVYDEIPDNQKGKDVMHLDMELLPVDVLRKLERFVNYHIAILKRDGKKSRLKDGATSSAGKPFKALKTEDGEREVPDDYSSESSFVSESEGGDDEA